MNALNHTQFTDDIKDGSIIDIMVNRHPISNQSVSSNGDKRMQALKVPLYPYHEIINYTNNLITFFDILRSIPSSG